jgi:uncharacterized protein
MTKTLLYILFLILLPITAAGSEFPAQQNPPRMVNDFAGIIGNQAADKLESLLDKFNEETSTQIAIVTVTNLHGYDIGHYAVLLAEKWEIGQRGKNNGILVLVMPRLNRNEGQAYIAMGYGLEGTVPDAIARRIVDNEMIPHFRNDDYHSGLLSTINVLMELTRGEYTADSYISRTGSREEAFEMVIFLFLFIIIFVIVSAARKSKQSSIGHSMPFWVLMSMMGSGSRRHTGQFGNFSSGSGSFGGGSRSFGGFGGGSFGGGGAGGRW